MKVYKTNSSIILNINDSNYNVIVSPNETLLHVIREKIGLTGAKPGCLHGNCGACTIIYDGLPMKSCLVLAVEAVGHTIQTIEGLKNNIVQESFIRNLAFQCGYCTSGFIMNIESLLNNIPYPDEHTIKTWLASNICRCTSYKEIHDAVLESIEKRR